jgi:hypothetical protein
VPSVHEKPVIRIAPDNPVFDLPVIYKHVDAYDPVLFTRTYDWMKARGLTEGGSEHAALII